MSSQKQDARLLCFYLIYQSFDGFPGGSVGEGSACSAGHLVSIPELGRSPGGRHGNPLQCSCLENPPRQRSLAGYRPWGCKQSDMTKRLRTNSIRVFSSKSALRIRWPKFWNFSFSINPSNEHSGFPLGLIDCFLLAVQGTLNSPASSTKM